MAFGGFQETQNSAPMSEINTTPLVDVMLVLLVIFIITAPLMTSAIKLDLPNAPSKTVQTKPDTIQLGINAAGEYFWNTTKISTEELKERMLKASELQPQPEIHLRADKLTHYAAIALVLGHAQSIGLSKVGFVTLPQDQPTQKKQ